jgi:hypothetical protein
LDEEFDNLSEIGKEKSRIIKFNEIACLMKLAQREFGEKFKMVEEPAICGLHGMKGNMLVMLEPTNLRIVYLKNY